MRPSRRRSTRKGKPRPSPGRIGATPGNRRPRIATRDGRQLLGWPLGPVLALDVCEVGSGSRTLTIRRSQHLYVRSTHVSPGHSIPFSQQHAPFGGPLFPRWSKPSRERGGKAVRGRFVTKEVSLWKMPGDPGGRHNGMSAQAVVAVSPDGWHLAVADRRGTGMSVTVDGGPGRKGTPT